MEEIEGSVDFERYTIRYQYYGNLLHLLGECHAFLAWKTSQKYSKGLSKVGRIELGKGQKTRTRTLGRLDLSKAWSKEDGSRDTHVKESVQTTKGKQWKFHKNTM
jgi:hypothetical protein